MEKINQILLTNIQRFSLHDGPGIRTTVFLKGCSLRCPWCSNPENLKSVPEQYIKDSVEGVYGKWYEPEELVKECLKDKGFYKGKLERNRWKISRAEDIGLLPGGVTFSGGECLLQMDRLVPVCEALHENGVHLTVETCLFASRHLLLLALENIDFFYVDMKILNAERCREVEKGNLGQYLSNLDVLMNINAPVIIRVPVIGNRTDNEENRQAVKKLLKWYNPLKVELIKEHNLGESKYKSLGLEMSYVGVEDSLMDQYKKELDEVGIPVEICRI